jgi:hypothetical protein
MILRSAISSFGATTDAQVRHAVQHFLALEERRTTDDAVRDVLRTERLLQHPRLRVRAVQHCEVFPPHLPRHATDLYLPGYGLRLGLLRLMRVKIERRTQRIAGVQLLGVPLSVAADHRVRRREDSLRRTVVLLQLDDGRTREVTLELQDVPHVRTAERVDGLVVISHDTQVAARTRQHPRHLELHGVGILVFIDHEVMPPLPQRLPHLLLGAQQLHGEQQQVVEVDGAARA